MTIPLRDNQHEVRLVGTPLDRDIIDHVRETGVHPKMQRQLPDGVQPIQVDDLEAALEGADLLISGVSSFGVDWFSEAVLPLIPDGRLPVLAVTKGLAEGPEGTITPFPYLWRERLEGKKNVSFNAIGGPCTSYELADRRHSCVAFCGDEPVVLEGLREMLETPYYHISVSTDVCGVEAAVGLKNAYALGVTLAVGMIEREEGIGCTPAYNPQAGLFGQSMREMGRLVPLFGGRPESVAYGVSDLYVTVFGGRTRRLGTLLGRGLTFAEAMDELEGITLESVAIATAVANTLRRREAAGQLRLADFPLLNHIDGLLNQGAVMDIPWERFERREL